MSKSKISLTAAKVFSDIIYETLQQTTNSENRRTLVNLNDNIIKAKYRDGLISYEVMEAMTQCFERERIDMGIPSLDIAE